MLAFCGVSVIAFAKDQIPSPERSANVHLSANVHQNPKIVALAPHIVEILYAIGAGEQIIGTTSYSNYPEAAKTIPVVGNYARLQIEKIVAMQPDVIVSWRSGNPVDDIERLQTLGFEVVYSNPTTLVDIGKDIIQLGRLSGRENEAERLAEEYFADLNALKQRYSNKPVLDVFYELWADPIRSVSGNAWPVQHLSLCGARNLIQSNLVDYPQVSLETVLARQPKVIIQSRSYSDEHFNKGDEKRVWTKWPSLPAVKNNFVILANADNLHRMSPKIIPEIKDLCEHIDVARRFYSPK